MKDNKFNLSLQDPQLPSALKDARRNHGGMTVPENFFEQFELKMNAVIDAEVKAQQPSIEIKPAVVAKKNKYWMSAAAAFVVLFVLSLVLHFVVVGERLSDKESPVQNIASLEQFEMPEEGCLPESVSDEMLTAASDFDVYEMYCDL